MGIQKKIATFAPAMRKIQDFIGKGALRHGLLRGVFHHLLLVWLVSVPATGIVAQNPIICDLTKPVTGLCDLFFTLSGRQAPAMDFDCWQFSETTTAIKEVENEEKAKREDVIYDLSGRRVNKNGSQKGIRIVGGKKIF